MAANYDRVKKRAIIIQMESENLVCLIYSHEKEKHQTEEGCLSLVGGKATRYERFQWPIEMWQA